MIGKTMEERSAGDYADLSRTVFEFDIHLVACVNGDIHLTRGNGQFVAKTCFRKRILDSVCSVGPSITAASHTPATSTIIERPSLKDGVQVNVLGDEQRHHFIVGRGATRLPGGTREKYS